VRGKGGEGYAACIWEGIHERIVCCGGILREITGSKVRQIIGWFVNPAEANLFLALLNFGHYQLQ
jgi:hypothetical protein